MDLLHIIILSVVEALTEFLPISSTAHLILTSHILGIVQSEFVSTFEIAIQLGAIGAVVVVYFKKILEDKQLFYKACFGFIPTGILGLVVYKHIKILLNQSIVPVIALFIGGIVIIAVEYYFIKKKKDNFKREMTYKDAFIIGLIQSISMVPGVSRAAASIFGGMALGFNREKAVEFSFLLAIPTMVAATGLDLAKSSHSFSQNQLMELLLGIVLSFVFALFVIRWIMRFVKTNNFIYFGVYRIVISVIYYFIFIH
jgi:undecaprenyl-diphosphatase